MRSISAVFVCVLFMAAGCIAQGNGAANRPGNVTAFQMEHTSAGGGTCKFTQPHSNGSTIVYTHRLVDHPIANGNKNAILSLTSVASRQYMTNSGETFSMYDNVSSRVTFGYVDDQQFGLASQLAGVAGLGALAIGSAVNVDCPPYKWLIVNAEVYTRSPSGATTVISYDQPGLLFNGLQLTVAKP